MKTIAKIAVAMAALMVMACSREERLFPFGWEKVNPQVDSLTLRLEHNWLDKKPDSVLIPDVRLMRELADADTTDLMMQIRAMYWEGRMMLRQGDEDGAYAIWRRAKAMNDSASHPYETNRLNWSLEPDPLPYGIQTYDYLSRQAEFFEEHGDYMLAADQWMNLAMMLNDLSQPERALVFANRSDSLNRIGGFEQTLIANGLNHSSIVYRAGDTRSTDSILRRLVADPKFRENPMALNYAYFNLFIECHDTPSIFLAYDMVRDREGFEELRSQYAAAIAGVYARRNEVDSAKHYADIAVDLLDYVEYPQARIDILAWASIAERAAGNEALANELLNARLDDTETQLYENRRTEVFNHDFNQRLHEAELKREADSHKSRMMMVMIILIIIIVTLIAVFFVYRRSQGHRIALIEESLKLEKSQRRVLAMKLALEQKESLISSIEENLASTDPEARQKVESAIRVHDAATGAETEAFITTFSELHPDFVPRLRRSYPNLTDTDHRMLSLIAVGLTNKQISNVMGIRPESVKQARWRLRNKMQLPPGATLESALGELVK